VRVMFSLTAKKIFLGDLPSARVNHAIAREQWMVAFG